MQIGMIGLGKMGYNLTLNLMEHNHQVHGYDVLSASVASFEAEGGKGHNSIQDLVMELEKPRKVWMMVPAGEVTESVTSQLINVLEREDIIIDGGNTNYKESIKRAQTLQKRGIHFLDVGTSGGVNGARNGACMMVGGNEKAFKKVEYVFRDLTVENGYHYTGIAGSGHFLKMIHNGIEYGMMQAIAEGFDILEKSPFEYDYEGVSKVWNHGSVIRSWLMELTENAFSKDEKLDNIYGVMHSSGEGKWTVETALDLQAAAPVIALSLMMRYRSLEEDTFAGKVVAALRNEFGGHDVVKKGR